MERVGRHLLRACRPADRQTCRASGLPAGRDRLRCPDPIPGETRRLATGPLEAEMTENAPFYGDFTQRPGAPRTGMAPCSRAWSVTPPVVTGRAFICGCTARAHHSSVRGHSRRARRAGAHRVRAHPGGPHRAADRDTRADLQAEADPGIVHGERGQGPRQHPGPPRTVRRALRLTSRSPRPPMCTRSALSAPRRRLPGTTRFWRRGGKGAQAG